MKRQEFLLNFTLVVIIGALIYLIYDSQDEPRTLKDLEAIASSEVTTEAKPRPKKNKAPGKETKYDANDETTSGSATEGEVADANNGSKFGKTDLFRALLTPTPTPTPPPPTPAPTPDIGKALGHLRLLSSYDGKALMEDVKKTEAGDADAIKEFKPGETMQVDIGNGIMKTATLKKVDDSDPYSPEVTWGLEGTDNEKKINFNTEPVVAPKGPGGPPQGQPGQPPQAAPAAPGQPR